VSDLDKAIKAIRDEVAGFDARKAEINGWFFGICPPSHITMSYEDMIQDNIDSRAISVSELRILLTAKKITEATLSEQR